MYLWTALLMGLIGSMHCAGMCGPIAISLPYRVGMQTKEETFFKILVYNIGRIITYAIFGLLFGIVGKGFFTMGVQKWFLIALAIVLIVVAIFSIDVESNVLKIPIIDKFNKKLKSALAKTLKNATIKSFLFIGILNGFLPCGLVYMAIAAAIVTGTVLSSVLYMVLFGIGTMPMMMALGYGGHLLSAKFRTILRKLYPLFMIIFAIMFIMRAFKINMMPDDFDFWMNKMKNIKH
jgi:sulfite exporter TauE/SafE